MLVGGQQGVCVTAPVVLVVAEGCSCGCNVIVVGRGGGGGCNGLAGSAVSPMLWLLTVLHMVIVWLYCGSCGSVRMPGPWSCARGPSQGAIMK